MKVRCRTGSLEMDKLMQFEGLERALPHRQLRNNTFSVEALEKLCAAAQAA